MAYQGLEIERMWIEEVVPVDWEEWERLAAPVGFDFKVQPGMPAMSVVQDLLNQNSLKGPDYLGTDHVRFNCSLWEIGERFPTMRPYLHLMKPVFKVNRLVQKGSCLGDWMIDNRTIKE